MNRAHFGGLLLIVLWSSVATPALGQPVTCFATPTGTTSGTCSTWATACTLSHVLDSTVNCDQVLVKQGTYGPIALRDNVKVFGGFAGTESSPSASNPTAYPTIVDGGGSARAVTSTGNGSATWLWGFTIRNGSDTGYDGGGGVAMFDSNAMFVRCVFENNNATWWGGAASATGNGSPDFVNCIFRDNGSSSTIAGGALHIKSAGSPRFTNCLFHDNEANEGGAAAVLTGTPKFVNCTFSKNSASIKSGGAVHDHEGTAEFTNSLLWDNEGAEGADEAYNDPIRRSAMSYTDVKGGWAGSTNLNADPLFVSSSSDDYTIPSNSPCVSKGKNTLVTLDIADLDWDGNTTEMVPFDLGGNPRKRGVIVDMGAYEAPLSGGSQ